MTILRYKGDLADWRGRAVLCLSLLIFFAAAAFPQNELQSIPDGGAPQRWLISNEFPAEIDAGMWENFNRFNIETLPQKDWLTPFGRPEAGTFKAGKKSGTDSSISNNTSNGQPLPEVGAASTTKTFADAAEITWREIIISEPGINFFALAKGKPVGTAYAAAYINSAVEVFRHIETDGFLGSIWLNGEKIYDGYSLTLKKVAAAKFRKGINLLLIRATGISGDYWRKDGGWSALIRFWNSKADAERSAEYKSVNKPGTIYYLEGFHVDPVYLQDQRGYSKVTLSNTNQYVNSLRADPKYGVFLSEIDYLKPYLDTHPEDREFLKQTVREGRVGTGGAYNQFNELTIGGEAMIRNILYGLEMHRAMLGRKSESLALWDVFGHAPQLSQIVKKSGFSGVVWSKKITGFQPFFRHYSPDGSSALHRRLDYAYSFSGFGSGKNYSFDNFRRMTERKFAEAQSFGSSVDLRINAADFTPPWTNLAGNVGKLNENRPQVKVTGQAQDLYFRDLNKEIAEGKVKPPVSSRDMLFFHVGVSMARSDLKIGQRLSENITLNAEKFASIAYLNGAKYPDLALDKAWRQIFFGSHHDAITGTPSDSAFLDLVLGYREAVELSGKALTDSLNFIAGKVDTSIPLKETSSQTKRPVSKTEALVVFNPMNWKRTDVVRVRVKDPVGFGQFAIRDSSGNYLEKNSIPDNKTIGTAFEFVAKDVPSLGYKTYWVDFFDDGQVSPSTDKGPSIENEHYIVKVDPNKGGAIASIYDKAARREVISTANGHFGNEIAALEEELTKKNVIYPAWELWTTGKKKFSTEKPAKVTSSNIAGRQELRIEGELPNMQRFVQTITLRTGIKRIDFKTELIDYKGYNELFTVNFPLALTGGALVTEDRFATVVRNGSKGFLDFRTNTDKLVSGSPVYSVNNWAEYGSVLNLNFVDAQSKSVASVPFKPAALVRPKGEMFEAATETVVSTLIKKGVSVTPFFDDGEAVRRKDLPIEDSTMPRKLNDDIAYHSFRIALGGEKENSYSADLLKLVSPETKAKFESQLLKDGFSYLFLYDKNVPEGWHPVPVLLIAGDLQQAIRDLFSPMARGEFSVSLPVDSFAVETNPGKTMPQVPDYGVALINNGTAGVSLENPNTLTMHLTHTAMFPGVNLPFEFVPENKTHVFTYSLYPHEKDWRAADTVRRGYEVNNPLMAVQTDVHRGSLPGEKSFLTTDGDKAGNVVLTTLKLGENPQATFQTKQLSDIRSFVLRFNETEGVQSSSNFFTFSPRVQSKDDQSFFDVFWRLQPADLMENKSPNKQAEQNTNIASAQFKQRIQGFDIETYSLRLDGQIDKKDKPRQVDLGDTRELIQPVYSRYWLHNMGAAPIGNDAVKVSLRPLEQMGNLSTFSWDDPYNQGGITTNAVRVQVVNNYQDRRISGEVTLEVPEDWRIVPDRIPYDIEAGGSFVKDVAVIAFPVKKNEDFVRALGLVKARIAHDGQVFQDVLQIGKPFKLEWRTEHTKTGVKVYIKNPYRQAIEGAVALITPPETWAGGLYSVESLFPREQGFTVGANAETILEFNHGQLPDGSWRIARLVYNGHLEYKRADGKVK